MRGRDTAPAAAAVLLPLVAGHCSRDEQKPANQQPANSPLAGGRGRAAAAPRPVPSGACGPTHHLASLHASHAGAGSGPTRWCCVLISDCIGPH